MHTVVSPENPTPMYTLLSKVYTQQLRPKIQHLPERWRQYVAPETRVRYLLLFQQADETACCSEMLVCTYQTGKSNIYK